MIYFCNNVCQEEFKLSVHSKNKLVRYGCNVNLKDFLYKFVAVKDKIIKLVLNIYTNLLIKILG